ncbi:MAG: zinc ribbon domain-containing protein [Pseudomonadota bacterium]
MPIFDHECLNCGFVFETLCLGNREIPLCPECGSAENRRLPGIPAVHIKGGDPATVRIERRVKDYLKDGNIAGAKRFADKAASMSKSEKAKRISDKLHQKTGD